MISAPPAVSPGQPIAAAHINALRDPRAARTLPNRGGAVETAEGVLLPATHPSPLTPYPPVDPLPWGPRWGWGIGFVGTTCKIWNAVLNLGATWYYGAGPFEVAVTDDGFWIGYQYAIADGSFSLVCQSAIPFPTAGILAGPLYKVAKWSEGGTERAIWTVDLAHAMAPTNIYKLGST